jgi:TfoX/Sxy family transcriptional regulator of competence genes
MKFSKPAPATVATFDRAFLTTGGERRTMFGCPCGFEAGQMYCGVFGDDLFVRLAEREREALLSRGGRPFEPMPGRRMREYVVLPGSTVEDGRALVQWMEKAREYARSLPPKAAKRARKPAAKPAIRKAKR